jgi:hypothetical protein
VGATVILVGIAVIAISIGVLPLVLVITGRRGATVITTLVAIWQLSELATVGDLISWILAPLAVLAIVAIWLPSSRRFIVARDPKQNSVNLVDH